MPRSKTELKKMFLKLLYEVHYGDARRYDWNARGLVNQWMNEYYSTTLSPGEKQLVWEAIQELSVAGLIAGDVTQPSEDFKVLTSKGKALAESQRDIEAYSIRLDDVVKDGELLSRTQDIFDLDRYEEAVFAAFKLVEEKVRTKAGLGPLDIGTDLMSKAFNPSTGRLTVPSAVTKAEQEAVHALFRGAIGLFKNPSSHRTVNYDDRLVTIKLIALAEVLLGILNDSVPR